jgi:hypothetical protein
VSRDAYLTRKYNITEAEYEKILKHQDGVCYICGQKPTKRRLAVDHDHVTGVVRGLLCFRCNKYVIGRHRDQWLFYMAYEYLDVPPAVEAIGERIAPRRKRTRRKKAVSRVRK